MEKGVEILNEMVLHKNETVALLTPSEQQELCAAVMKTTPKEIASAITGIPVIERCVKAIILEKIDKDCKSLCSKKFASILRTPRSEHSQLAKIFCWSGILNEMKERAPDILNVLTTIAAPNLMLDGRQVPPICMAYALLMNTRNRELSMVQKMNTVVIGAGHATEKTFRRLGKLGVTQSRDNLRNLMDDVGSDCESTIRDLILLKKKNLRIVFDNIDFKILANIILKNHQNSDIHWMAQYCTFDRFASENLDDTTPLVSNIESFENKEYLLSQEELNKLKCDFTVLVSRVLVEFFPCLYYLQKNVCIHIPHRYSNEMAIKSTVISLPILPFNQSKHSDVCKYLDHMQEFLLNVHSPKYQSSSTDKKCSTEEKEKILKGVNVPLCGDLLGRERVTGAKKTRLGCDQQFDKFQNITEFPALWHTKQSFLGYIWEQLYKPSPVSGREIGTLYHLRQLFHMTNVYSSVKKNYKSAENLMLSATKAYICCSFMKFAGLDSLEDSTPSKIELPAENASNILKETFLKNTVGQFVDEYVMVELPAEKSWQTQQKKRLQAKEKLPTTCTVPSSLPELLSGQVVILVLQNTTSGYKVIGVGKVVNVVNQDTMNVSVLVISIEPDAQNVGLRINEIILWPRKLIAIPNMPYKETTSNTEDKTCQSSTDCAPDEDRLFNYASQCIQLGIMLMQLNDTEKEGDGERSIINWKLLMLYFRARKRGTKYAFEAMRVITLIKALCTERTAHRLIHGQFVNLKGGLGKNCANDLAMEMMIKNHKVMLKGMCGNKTLKAVERSTKASHGIKKIVDAYDEMNSVPPDSTSHTHASTKEDIIEMVRIIKPLNPFKHTPKRNLQAFSSMQQSPLNNLDTSLLHTWLTRHKKRLARDTLSNCDDDVDDDSMDEDLDLENDVEDD
ncbi:uncharacterized protein LOC114531236 isoform X2 [Dendronephthya gigantea]|uniref:uncharacterized protein LOC114531236 isoform X2 n=1 Tax=Dendronephthya gigantea TaxID=151771 RepID=UPI00106AE934|nr:uncharacterized protein LOC114531236 isoform X2 [Dendronephthya gigantea]